MWRPRPRWRYRSGSCHFCGQLTGCVAVSVLLFWQARAPGWGGKQTEGGFGALQFATTLTPPGLQTFLGFVIVVMFGSAMAGLVTCKFTDLATELCGRRWSTLRYSFCSGHAEWLVRALGWGPWHIGSFDVCKCLVGLCRSAGCSLCWNSVQEWEPGHSEAQSRTVKT